MAANSLQWPVRGDIDMLSHTGQWRGIIIPPGEAHSLQCNAADMKRCFYLFRLPRAWRPYSVINASFESDELGVQGAQRNVFLTSGVIPMGWCSAMGLVQYLYRRILTLGTGSPSAGLLLDREIRKDKPLPVLAALAGYEQLWQVYADDLDLPSILAPDPEEAFERRMFHVNICCIALCISVFAV